MTTQMIFSQVPSYVPSNGLVGYWPFNGNANDESGNGNNGTPNGTTLTTDRFGNANSAYNFDGFLNNIEIPQNANLNLTQSMSISMWFKLEPKIGISGAGHHLIVKGSNFTNEYSIVVSNDELNIGFNKQGVQPIAISPVNMIDYDVWYQVVAVYNYPTAYIYINGNIVSQGDISAPFSSSNSSLYLGTINGNQGADFVTKGKIDDVGIWNRALSQQEITNMYNGVNYSDTCNAVSGSLTQGLVGYWPFCGNANDDSGNGNNGTVNGATLTTDRFGNSNSAYSFNGVNNFISCLNNNIPAGNSSRTFSAWFYLTPTNGYSDGYSVLSYGTNTFPDGRLNDIFIKENEVEFNTHMNYSINTNPLNNNNLWHNIVVVYNNTNVSSIIIYLDGIQIQTSNFNLVNLNTLNTLNTNLLFGKSIVQYASNFYFNGKIDDIGIWNRALTPQEITQLYNQNQCTTNITVTDTLIINVGQLSYTNPVTYANNITIYPNPASTQVNISFNNITDLTGGTIKVINSLGQQVATTPITLSGTNTTMPLNTWGGTGLYFVQILNAQGIVVDVKKIILQ